MFRDGYLVFVTPTKIVIFFSSLWKYLNDDTFLILFILFIVSFYLFYSNCLKSFLYISLSLPLFYDFSNVYSFYGFFSLFLHEKPDSFPFSVKLSENFG